MKRLSIACVALAAVAGSAQAVVLNPGDIAVPPGLAVFLGAKVADMFSPVVSAKYNGVLESAVYQEGNGNLDFWFQYSSNQTSVDSNERLTFTDFTGNYTDVDYISTVFNPNPNLVNPVYCDRSAAGDTVGFQFVPTILGGNGTIDPGMQSDWLEIKTEAKRFSYGTANVIDGSVTSVYSYAPVPEPTAIVALSVGLAGLVRRRRIASK